MPPACPPELRFWKNVDRRGDDECWRWTGVHGKGGYGRIKIGRRYVYVHRFAYELLVGPIPPRLVVDHVRAKGCQHRDCVNPAHLEAITQRENLLRSLVNRRVATATHCVNGHEFPEPSLSLFTNGRRRCRICKTAQQRAWRQKGGRAHMDPAP